jgi:hypothetical protein
MFQGVCFQISVFLFSILLTAPNFSKAEVWDLGYNKPEVEEIPESIETAESSVDPEQESGSAINSNTLDAVANAEKNLRSSSVDSKDLLDEGKSYTRISTSKNTFGVETIENPGVKFYFSPTAGLISLLGNSTINVAPQYSLGGRVGVLISGNLMFEGGYTFSSINTSAPITSSLGYQPDNVFELRQSNIDAGVKLFFLGRESRLRPFVGASFGLARSRFGYTSIYKIFSPTAPDFQIQQFLGMGQLGAEFAITKSFVISAAFGVNGVLTSSTQTSLNELTASGLEANRLQAGNSLSRSATYQGSIGVGLYF